MTPKAVVHLLPVLLVAGVLASCSSKKLSDAPHDTGATLPSEADQPLAQAGRVDGYKEQKSATVNAPPPPAAAAREEAVFAKRANQAEAYAAKSAHLGGAKFDDKVAQARQTPLQRVRAGEELWIVSKLPLDAVAPPSEAQPTICGLHYTRGNGEQEIPLPLQHTDVRASVAGYVASVNVQQQYLNPFNEKIEAVYVFPLPEDAAVNEFVMTIGARRIRGIIREREEAQALYAEAKQQGYVASLLTQERPNIFTQSVANIEPGKEIDIDLTYFNTLRYADGAYELVFPMVVGPRFNPPGRRGIGAVARGANPCRPGECQQQAQVEYLAPSERSGHDIGLVVDIDAGVSIESIDSPSHVIETKRLSPSRARVELSRRDAIPNKDFVLRYAVAGDEVKSAFISHRDRRGGFFTLMLEPPAELEALPRAPLEMVFVLDCSGSMSGYPIAKAKAALERALRRLGPDDTFQIVRFSDHASQLGAAPLPATQENVERALRHVEQLTSEGGTMMSEGIAAALDFAHDPRRLRIVSFMTDGYIGNEADILGLIQQRLGETRIFSFGVGSSVNRYLLEGMARLGRGAVAYVGPDESADRAVDTFYARVAHPALTDIAIDWGDLQVSQVYPQRLPDLFVSRPVILTGKFSGEAPTTITISGRAGGRRRSITLPIDPEDSQHPAIASLWARTRITELEDEQAREPRGDSAPQITSTALQFGLMSAYTAFVAVDSAERTAGAHGTTVIQPVPVPEGVRYDTTVSEQTH